MISGPRRPTRLLQGLFAAAVLVGAFAFNPTLSLKKGQFWTRAMAAEALKVRGAKHEGYGRLVLEWPAPAQYAANLNGRRMVVTFDRAAAIDPAAITGALPSHISDASLSEDGLALTLMLTADYSLKAFDLDRRMVFDLVGATATSVGADDKAQAAKQPEQKSEAKKATSQNTAADKMARIVPPRRPAPPAKPESVAAPATAAPAEEVTTTLAEETSAEPVPSSAPLALVPGQPERPAQVSAETQTQDKGTEDVQALPVSQAHDGVFELRRLPRSQDLSPPMGRSAEPILPLELRFTWDRPAKAAGFSFAGFLWVIFDRLPPADLAQELAEAMPDIRDAKVIPATGATVLRLGVNPLMTPKFSKDGDTWIVDLRPRVTVLEEASKIELVDDGPEGLVRVTAPERGRMIWLTDPHSGNRLVVIPSAVAGAGVPERFSYAQFEALETQQGVALQPLSQGIEVANAKSGVLIRDKSGLKVSSNETRGLMPRDLTAGEPRRRLFNLPRWRLTDQEGFTDTKQALMRKIIDAQGQERTMARWDLARFYFAWGLSSEALALLRVIETDSPRLAKDPEFLLMRAASHFLLREYDEAADILQDPVLSGEWDAKPWRGALLASAQDWEAAAGFFAESESLISAYPRLVRVRLRLLAAEARLGIHDSGGASAQLVRLSQDSLDASEAAQAKFLTGQRFYLDGEYDLARQLWRELAADNHRASQARARLSLLDLALQEETISKEEAVAELERLRFAWRGDTFEVALLTRLAAVYRKNGDYRKALITMRQTAANFPDSVVARSLALQMRDLFAELYLTDLGDALPPLQALSLYEEFKELTPPGPQGDAMIARLADRLVEVDLLPQAAKLLTDQMNYRLEGLEKAKAGSQLAMILLLDKQAEQALEAIENSHVAEMPLDLASERRLMRARALAQLQQTDAALALIDGDDSPAAVRLRGEIKWQMRDWAGAAKELDKQIPQKPPSRPLSATESEKVADLAMALTLADDRVRLMSLNKRYKNAMAGSEHAELFKLLADGVDPNGPRSIADGLDQVEAAQAFMSSYEAMKQKNAVNR